ncbi:hypothetical protein MP228_002310 [Amoeboaphelidium protococcarum]|nr:hypothetical protein MP228_002310 [Amoeboaphelidium protococcarum]
MTVQILDQVNVPWTEKYRPRVLEEVVGNAEIVDRLKVIAKDGNMPHLILSGPSGIGKTTSIMCLAHELLPKECIAEAVLELNASDDRGIDVVRNKIKMFCQKKVTLPPNRQKIVILDECDSMTSGAQQALRRTMEIYSGTTRFALACNLSNKIIEPIQSRCAMLRYQKLNDKEMLTRLMAICKLENVSYSPEGLEALIFCAEGDLRNAVNNLQSTWSGFGHVNEDTVFKVCDSPHPAVIKKILTCTIQGNVDEAVQILGEVYALGYSALDIINTLFKVVKFMRELDEARQLEYVKIIGFTHMRILDGVNSLLQLSSCIAQMCECSTN